jgi:hypothetical protein
MVRSQTFKMLLSIADDRDESLKGLVGIVSEMLLRPFGITEGLRLSDVIVVSVVTGISLMCVSKTMT